MVSFEPARMDRRLAPGARRCLGPTWEGQRVSLVVDPPTWVLTSHAHSAGKVFFVVRGGFWEQQGGGIERVAAGDVFLRPPNAPHADQYGPDGSFAIKLELDSQAWVRSPALREIEAPTLVRALGVGATAQRIANAIRSGEDRDVPSLVDGLLARISATRRLSAAPSWLANVKRRISGDAVRSVRRAELAEEAGVHPVHLAQSFRRYFGTTIDRYTHRCRVFEASEAMLASDVGLSDLATRLGFYDQSHLARAFHRERGVSPGAFRRTGILTRV